MLLTNRDSTIVVLWSDHGWQLGEKQRGQKFTEWRVCTRVPLIIRVPTGAITAGNLASTAVGVSRRTTTSTKLSFLHWLSSLQTDGRRSGLSRRLFRKRCVSNAAVGGAIGDDRNCQDASDSRWGGADRWTWPVADLLWRNFSIRVQDLTVGTVLVNEEMDQSLGKLKRNSSGVSLIRINRTASCIPWICVWPDP